MGQERPFERPDPASASWGIPVSLAAMVWRPLFLRADKMTVMRC